MAKVMYRFEGVIKSSVRNKQVLYTVEPTAEYSITDPKNRSRREFVAFPCDPKDADRPAHFLSKDELKIEFLLDNNATWLGSHADTDKKVVFEFKLQIND